MRRPFTMIRLFRTSSRNAAKRAGALRINFILLAAVAGIIAQGCKDQGSPVSAPLNVPAISSVIPDSAAVRDTIVVIGTNFGAAPLGSRLVIGDVIAETIISWSSTEIHAVVPPGARSSSIIVTVNGFPSNARSYVIKGSAPGRLSFALDVQPIFLTHCALPSCHASSSPAGNFNATTYAGIRDGGYTYGTTIVIPGDSTKSGVMKMVRSANNLIGLRMPISGPYTNTGLPDSLIVKIGKWVVQGAVNN